MKTTIHTLSALLSGAFLNLGFDRLAEWFDPLTAASDGVLSPEFAAALPCIHTEVLAEFTA